MMTQQRAIILFLYGMAFVIGYLLGSVVAANAHMADSGWDYPASCCSGTDCGKLPSEYVKATATGYQVHVPVNVHQSITIEDKDYFIPYSDAHLKISPDGWYHLCVGRQYESGGVIMGGSLYCFFAVPPGS